MVDKIAVTDLLKRMSLLAGGLSSLLGVAGASMAVYGFCPCVLAPFLIFSGPIIIAIGYIKTISMPLIIFGIALIILGVIWGQKKTCSVHHKKVAHRRKE